MLFSSIYKKSASEVLQKVRDRLPQLGKNVVKNAAPPKIEVKPFEDFLALSNGDPPITGAELANLTFTPARSPISLKGGHNPIEAMTDQFKRFWVFKGRVQKASIYRTVGDKVGDDMAGRVGQPTVGVYYASQQLKGKIEFGTLSPLIAHSGERLPEDVSLLTPKQKNQLTASHVFRWLIGDHDGKAANFLVLKNGDVLPIDYGNMYRNFGKDKLDRHYQPNSVEPVFNKMWDAYVKGNISLDFKAGMAQVARIEALPDAEFIKLLKPYVDAKFKQAGYRTKGLETPEKFMAAAVKRKDNLRADFMDFYSGLVKERAMNEIGLTPGEIARALRVRAIHVEPVREA